jgi:hypothetical protein
MTEVRKRQDQSAGQPLEAPVNPEPKNAANLLHAKTSDPMWLWAVFGLIVVSALVIGLLFGGDGGNS